MDFGLGIYDLRFLDLGFGVNFVILGFGYRFWV